MMVTLLSFTGVFNNCYPFLPLIKEFLFYSDVSTDDDQAFKLQELCEYKLCS